MFVFQCISHSGSKYGYKFYNFDICVQNLFNYTSTAWKALILRLAFSSGWWDSYSGIWAHILTGWLYRCVSVFVFHWSYFVQAAWSDVGFGSLIYKELIRSRNSKLKHDFHCHHQIHILIAVFIIRTDTRTMLP